MTAGASFANAVAAACRPWSRAIAAVGGVTGALVGMGIPEFEAKRYEGKIKAGNILISVHSDDSDQTKLAKEIFEQEGAEDINSVGESKPPEVNTRGSQSGVKSR